MTDPKELASRLEAFTQANELAANPNLSEGCLLIAEAAKALRALAQPAARESSIQPIASGADPHVLLGRIVDAATDLAHLVTSKDQRESAASEPMVEAGDAAEDEFARQCAAMPNAPASATPRTDAINERHVQEVQALMHRPPSLDSLRDCILCHYEELTEHADTLERELAEANRLLSVYAVHETVQREAALLEQLAAAQEDAERLDWIDTLRASGLDYIGYGDYRYYVHGTCYPKVREVIDAARAERKEP